MSKFIEINGKLIKKSSIFQVDEIVEADEEDRYYPCWLFWIEYKNEKKIVVARNKKEEAQAERRRIINELEKD